MELDRDDDQAVHDELLELIRGKTGGGFRITEDGGCIELIRWGRADFTALPLRLLATRTEIAQHLREMEGRAALVFPELRPIIGALQLFVVHVGEAIATRGAGETELIPHPGGVRPTAPDTSTLDRDDDQAVHDELLDHLRIGGGWAVRVPASGSCVELTGWEQEDFTAEPLRLHGTASAFAEHLRDVEDGMRVFFPNARPITGALQLFVVHVDEAIATRASGETELIPYSAGVRSEQPVPLDLDRDDDRAVHRALLDLLRRATGGNVRISAGGDRIELSDWYRKDPLAEPFRLHGTASAFAEHLRDMEGGDTPDFPGVPPIGGALRRFLVHVQEVIVAGGTELIVGPDGTRSGPPDE